MSPRQLSGLLAPVLLLAPADLAAQAADQPIVIAHRGASGYRPEHTLAAYRLAIEQGADFIEPDLVITRDGELIARHENLLAAVRLDEDDRIALVDGRPVITEATTNIADLPELAGYLTVKVMDGRAVGGWFSEDLTLAQIGKLRARERVPRLRPGSASFDDEFPIPTLGQVIDLVRNLEETTGRAVGIYPETKHPTWFALEGRHLDVETGRPGDKIAVSLGRRLLETLVQKDFTDPRRVFIQSFEVENLRELQHEIMPEHDVDLPLIQLLGGGRGSYDMEYNLRAHGGDREALREIYGELVDLVEGGMLSRAVLAFMARDYAEGIGPSTSLVLPRRQGVLTGEAAPFLAEALTLGLEVHPLHPARRGPVPRPPPRRLSLDHHRGDPQASRAGLHRLLHRPAGPGRRGQGFVPQGLRVRRPPGTVERTANPPAWGRPESLQTRPEP